MESSRRQFSLTEPQRNGRLDWSAWLSLQLTIFGVISFVGVLIWALTGGQFWPIWAAMGLALPVALQVSIREALKAPRRWRGLAIQGAITAVLCGLHIFIWVLTGGYFWPIWPMLGLGAALALHAVLLNQFSSLRPRER